MDKFSFNAVTQRKQQKTTENCAKFQHLGIEKYRTLQTLRLLACRPHSMLERQVQTDKSPDRQGPDSDIIQADRVQIDRKTG